MFTWIAKPLMAAVVAVGGYCNFQSTRHAACESKQGKAAPPAYAYDPAEVRITFPDGRDVTKDTKKNIQQPVKKKKVPFVRTMHEYRTNPQYVVLCFSRNKNFTHTKSGFVADFTPLQWDKRVENGVLALNGKETSFFDLPFVECEAMYKAGLYKEKSE